MTTLHKNLLLPFKDGNLIGDEIVTSSPTTILFVHGGALRGRELLLPLREELAKRGYGSYAFDLKGHGETGGDIKKTSLKEKVEQIAHIIRSYSIPKTTIIASSMGGYVAVKVAEETAICNLVLLVPAAYDKEAYLLPFGEGFTDVIRKEESWRESDAFSALQKFTGNLLVVEAKEDAIIPKEIPKMLYDAAIKARSRNYILLENATHPVILWSVQHKETMDLLAESIVSVLEKDGM